MTKQILILILLVSCSFGRITTDTVKAGVGEFSGPLTGTTLNTGNGANELYPMDQDVRTTASVTHDTLTITKGMKLGTGAAAGPTATPHYIDLGKDYSDGATADKCKLYFYQAGIEKYGLGIGDDCNMQYHARNAIGKHEFYINDIEKFRVNNTGVNVTGLLNADSITTNGTDYIKYSAGTFPCTLSTTYVVARDIVTANYEVFNKFVRVNIPTITGTAVGATNFILLNCGGFPSQIRPTAATYGTVLTKVNPVDISIVNSGSAAYGTATVNIIGGVIYPVISYGFTGGIIGTNSNILFQYYLD